MLLMCSCCLTHHVFLFFIFLTTNAINFFFLIHHKPNLIHLCAGRVIQTRLRQVCVYVTHH